MANRTYTVTSPWRHHTSTVVKSMAAIVDQCAPRKVFQDLRRPRAGAGSMPFLFKMLATVVRAT